MARCKALSRSKTKDRCPNRAVRGQRYCKHHLSIGRENARAWSSWLDAFSKRADQIEKERDDE